MPDAYYDRISAVLTGAARQPVWTPDVQAVGSAFTQPWREPRCGDPGEHMHRASGGGWQVR